MQSTIREHRDGGNAGGVFSRYNIIKVWHWSTHPLDPPAVGQQGGFVVVTRDAWGACVARAVLTEVNPVPADPEGG